MEISLHNYFIVKVNIISNVESQLCFCKQLQITLLLNVVYILPMLKKNLVKNKKMTHLKA
ncbi:hypothetical protein B5S43_08465 [Gilliamella apicola]|nr:hypothetical protein B5S43_08465 [Gilliamella apicola]OTQ21592.1 hypothetical protein B6D22_09130 [Gilliamella apicola]